MSSKSLVNSIVIPFPLHLSGIGHLRGFNDFSRRKVGGKHYLGGPESFRDRE